MRLFARLSTCLVLCLPPALLGHCGAATDGGLMGTETGNPPVVDSQKLRLVATAAGMELIAQPGAVSPGAQVRLENRSAGVSAVVTANPDGSFRVVVAGTALHTYEAVVTARGRSVTVSLVAADAQTGVTPDPGERSCELLENGLTVSLNAAIDPFAAGCTTDSDCEILWWDVGCYDRCGYSYVLAAQQSSAVAAAEQSIAGACSELASRDCPRLPPPGCPGGATSAMCHQGTCQALDLDRLSCDGLEARATQLVAEAFASVDRSCNVDADCTTTIVPGASCAYSCYFSGAIAASAVSGLQQSIEAIETGVCGASSARPCPPPEAPPCAGPDVTAGSVCVDNRCTIQEEP